MLVQNVYSSADAALARIRVAELNLDAGIIASLNAYANHEFDCGSHPRDSPKFQSAWVASKFARADLLEKILAAVGACF